MVLVHGKGKYRSADVIIIISHGATGEKANRDLDIYGVGFNIRNASGNQPFFGF